MRSEIANIYIIVVPIAIHPRLARPLSSSPSMQSSNYYNKVQSMCACDLDDDQRVEEFEPVEIAVFVFKSRWNRSLTY